MNKCKNCGHGISVDENLKLIRHRKLIMDVFTHYYCTKECTEENCDCANPEVLK